MDGQVLGSKYFLNKNKNKNNKAKGSTLLDIANLLAIKLSMGKELGCVGSELAFDTRILEMADSCSRCSYRGHIFAKN